MARIIPKANQKRITFFQTRLAEWNDNAEALNLSFELLEDISVKVQAAEQAYQRAHEIRQQSAAATMALNDAVKQLVRSGSHAINQIKLTAAMEDSSEPFVLGLVPPPNTPSPLGAPDAPENLRFSIQQGPAIRLDWEGSRENGVFFTVYRKTSFEKRFACLGSVRSKSFVDCDLPEELSSATYYVIAQRNDSISEKSMPVTVQLTPTGAKTITIAA